MRLIAGLCLAAITSAGTAFAGDHPVVLELFTSQGCSSCPPADALLEQLATRDDVIALALHVDYWDYLGWTDDFGSPAHAQRQRGYARAAGENMIYTPQMIVAGQDHVIGYRPGQVSDLLRKHAAMPDALALEVTHSGGRLHIRADGALPGDVQVQLVGYAARKVVDVRRGENAGKRLSYVNVVESWETLRDWDGSAPLDMRVSAPQSDHAVVIIQQGGYGPILAAARAD